LPRDPCGHHEGHQRRTAGKQQRPGWMVTLSSHVVSMSSVNDRTV
jgi:hypothetical protein